MDDRDQLSSALPPPRDDEPSSLRDDIVDELMDHLACAYRREIMRGADEITAKEHVRSRFGDPAAVARRLWLDAMKGKIMTSRALRIYSIAITLICLGLVATFWRQSLLVQREQMATLRAQMEAARSAQEAMLQRLEAMAKQTPAVTSEWIPVKFKLVEETIDGPPVAGVKATLGRGKNLSANPDAIERTSDENGTLDFGHVQPGDWHFQMSLLRNNPNKNQMADAWQSNGVVTANLGTSLEKTFVCPRINVTKVPVQVKLEWPAGLDTSELMATVFLESENINAFNQGLRWFSGFSRLPGEAILAFEDDATSREANGNMRLATLQPYFWRSVIKSLYRMNSIYLDFPKSDQSEKSDQSSLIQGQYRLKLIAVARRMKEPIADFSGVRGKVLVTNTTFDESTLANGRDRFLQREVNAYQINLIEITTAPDDAVRRELSRITVSYASLGGTSPMQQVSPDSTRQIMVTPFPLPGYPKRETRLPESSELYEAKVGQDNEWVIRVPDEYIEPIREGLKAKPES